MAISVIEPDGDVARYLDVLFLVGSYRDNITFINQDISSLENRIRKQAVIRTKSLGDFVLVACAPLQKAHRRYAGKKPGKLSNLRHIGLTPEYSRFRIEAESYVIGCHIESVLSEVSRRRVTCEGVVVGDKIKTIVLGLELQVLAYCAEEIADMEPA